MFKGILFSYHPLGKLLFFLALCLLTYFVVLGGGILISTIIFHLNIDQIFVLLSGGLNEHNINVLKYFQMIQSIGLFIFPPLIIGYFISGNSYEYIGLSRKPVLSLIIIAALLMVIALPLINFAADLNMKLNLPGFLNSFENWMKLKENDLDTITKELIKANNFSVFLLNLLIVAIIPAFGEEFLFRGVLQRIFQEWTKNIHIGIIITSLIFALVHLQFFTFLPRFLLGLALGYLFAWSGSIWLSITAHFTNNALAVFVYYVFQEKFVEKNFEHVGATPDSLIFLILSFILSGMMLYVIFNKTKQENEKLRSIV